MSTIEETLINKALCAFFSLLTPFVSLFVIWGFNAFLGIDIAAELEGGFTVFFWLLGTACLWIYVGAIFNRT